ncbi:uncharacterized protein SCHCODRAFT_02490858, partial [Schizophyllum commune H4-8]|uniref:uncharacterized protein n=1 Tax=Schizophyllum commune (strain H4-8 / FGSC 9210) TaxID=578458 RepID=UPI002160B28C
KIKYLVDWKGFGPEARTWEPVTSLENAPKKINEFHKKHPDKPRTVEEWEEQKRNKKAVERNKKRR